PGKKRNRNAGRDHQGCGTNRSWWSTAADLRPGVSSGGRTYKHDRRLGPADSLGYDERQYSHRVGTAHQQSAMRAQTFQLPAVQHTPTRHHHRPQSPAKITTVHSQTELHGEYRSRFDLEAKAKPLTESAPKAQRDGSHQKEPWKHNIEDRCGCPHQK